MADVLGSLYKKALTEEHSQKHQKEVAEGLKEACGNEQKLQEIVDNLNI